MTSTEIPAGATLLTTAEVCERVKMGERTLYTHVSAGRFPKPIRTCDSPRAPKRWISSEVDEWIRKRAEERDDQP